MQEKPSFISEILKEILLDILDFHNTLPKTQPPSNSPSIFELLEHLSLRIPVKSPEFSSIYQIKVKPQFTESLCGFHSLFYAKTFLKSLQKARNINERIYYLSQLNSHAKFWKFYRKTLKKVLENPLLQDFEIDELLDFGPLDSSHLDFLINSGFFKGFSIKIASIFYGYGYFQCGLPRIQQVQQFFSEENSDFHLIFLGITSHWMAFFIKKKKSILFDSRNSQFFLNKNYTIKALEKLEDFERLFIGKKPMNSSEIQLFEHNMRDGRFFFEVLQDFQQGKYTLFHVFLNRIIFDLIRSFETMVFRNELDEYCFENYSKENCFFNEIPQKNEENNEEILMRFSKWLRFEKRPRIIKEDLYENLKLLEGNRYLFKKTQFLLVNWIKELENCVLQIKKHEFLMKNEPEPEIFEELMDIIKEINSLFS